VSITLENDYFCGQKWNRRIALTATSSYFKDQGEVVIFDETRKYETRIPTPALTAPKSGSRSVNPV
jgi:hypothetical protein